MSEEEREPRHGEQAPAWLAAARDDLRSRRAPEWIESRLQAAAAEQRTLQALQSNSRQPGTVAAERKPPRTWWRPLWLAPAMVGALALGLVILLFMPPTAVAPAVAAPARFIALASMDAIAAEPAPRIVPAQLPRATLAEFGLPVDPARADVPVRTELLMSPRGVVLAVRFVE
jgi:hypothetical protein